MIIRTHVLLFCSRIGIGPSWMMEAFPPIIRGKHAAMRHSVQVMPHNTATTKTPAQDNLRRMRRRNYFSEHEHVQAHVHELQHKKPRENTCIQNIYIYIYKYIII